MKLFSISLPLLGVAMLLSACRTTVNSSPEKTVVTVNSTSIQERQILEEADRRIDADAARSANSGLVYDQSFRPKTRAVIRDDVLHTLIERQLIMDQLKADNLEVTDAEVDARFLEKARSLGQTPEEAEVEIRAQGKTLSDVKQKLRWHTLGVEKLYEAHATNKKVMTEADARKLYMENPAEYVQEHERRVSRILINAPPDLSKSTRAAARARADEILKRIKAGEDFAELARTYSEDPITRVRGGDRGWSPRGFVTAVGNDPFGDAAFAMKNVGDVSDVVTTLDGFEIIKLTGTKEGRQKSFDEVKGQIIAREMHWEIGNFWEQYAENMRSGARIEWDPQEKLRRDRKEIRDRKYNQKIEKQIARQEQRVKEKDRYRERGHPPKILTNAPPAALANSDNPTSTQAPGGTAANVQ